MATGSMSKGPGKSYREGLSLDRLFRMFPTDEAAEAWFTAERWPGGPYCPHCGSRNVQCGIAHPTMTHRCRDCPKRRMFSLKTGTVMQGSPLGYRTWLAAIYLVATNLKGVSSMKLHRDLGINQKSAWYLAHRIRKAWKEVGDPFAGPVQAGEGYIEGIESFWAMLKRAHAGTFHKISAKHMDRYVTEFAGPHNNRKADTPDKMGNIVRGMIGRRISYCRLDRFVGARGSENPDRDDQRQAGGTAQALLLPAEQSGVGGRHRYRHHARGSPACRRVRREARIRRKCLIEVVVTSVYKPLIAVGLDCSA